MGSAPHGERPPWGAPPIYIPGHGYWGTVPGHGARHRGTRLPQRTERYKKLVQLPAPACRAHPAMPLRTVHPTIAMGTYGYAGAPVGGCRRSPPRKPSAQVEKGGTGNAQIPFSSSKYIHVHTTNTGSGGGRRGSIRQLWGAAGKTLANYRAPQAEITLIIGRTRAPYAEIVASIVCRKRKYWTACSLWKRWQQETSNVLRVSFIAPGRR